MLKLQRWQGHPRNLTRHSVADRSLSQIRTYEHCDAHSTEDRCKSNQNRICLAAQTISKRQAAYLFFRARPRVCPHRAVGNVENRRCLGECHEHKRVRNPVTLLKSAAATPLPNGPTGRELLRVCVVRVGRLGPPNPPLSLASNEHETILRRGFGLPALTRKTLDSRRHGAG